VGSLSHNLVGKRMRSAKFDASVSIKVDAVPFEINVQKLHQHCFFYLPQWSCVLFSRCDHTADFQDSQPRVCANAREGV